MKIIYEQPGKIVDVSKIGVTPTAGIGTINHGLDRVNHEKRDELLHSGQLSKRGEDWVRKNRP